jgi:hypothetical protein
MELASVRVIPAATKAPQRLMRILGDFGGAANSPMAWASAAVARRELTRSAAVAAAAIAATNVVIDTQWDSTQVSVHDSATGVQIGDTITLDGGEATLTYAAHGTRAMVTTTVYGAAAHTTEVAVIDTTTGTQLGVTRALKGRRSGPPLIDADGVHVLIAVGEEDTTAVVIDTTTGEQTGTTLTVEGTLGYSLADDNQTHVLITTSHGDSTHIVTVNSATGEQTGATLTFAGQVVGWPTPTTSADGTHVLFIVSAAGETRAVLMDITTGTQTGTGITIAGDTRLSPIRSDDGALWTVVSAVGATDAHGSSTHIAVIDTTTGNQVGVTTDLTGTAGIGSVTYDGKKVVVKTSAGLRATVDTITGTAVVDVAGFPWGFDLERLGLKLQELEQTPLGRFGQTVAYALLGLTLPVRVALAGLVFWIAIGLGSLFSSFAPPASMQATAAPTATPDVIGWA